MPDSGWVILELLDDYSPRKYWTEIKKEIKLNIDDDLECSPKLIFDFSSNNFLA